MKHLLPKEHESTINIKARAEETLSADNANVETVAPRRDVIDSSIAIDSSIVIHSSIVILSEAKDLCISLEGLHKSGRAQRPPPHIPFASTTPLSS